MKFQGTLSQNTFFGKGVTFLGWNQGGREEKKAFGEAQFGNRLQGSFDATPDTFKGDRKPNRSKPALISFLKFLIENYIKGRGPMLPSTITKQAKKGKKKDYPSNDI